LFETLPPQTLVPRGGKPSLESSAKHVFFLNVLEAA
jgi:hypothetical protein